jgi:hypothetical protein
MTKFCSTEALGYQCVHHLAVAEYHRETPRYARASAGAAVALADISLSISSQACMTLDTTRLALMRLNSRTL